MGAMLQDSNKCFMCKQKLHLDWWSSQGICDANEEIRVGKRYMFGWVTKGHGNKCGGSCKKWV